jgi:hypothetical protein
MIVRFVPTLIVLFLTPLLWASAITNDFTIRTLIGGDTTPPTTPVLLSAVPLSTDQIDVTWSAATDDFLLTGYQVFRGLTQIATTTLTSYSDTGLTPNTLYTYSVRAYDSAFNISSSSNSIATRTLQVTATSTPEQGTQTSSKAFSLKKLDIMTDTKSALFTWETTSVAKFQLRWGRTTSYELGFVSSNIFKKGHETKVTDLEARTTYEYELIGFTQSGLKVTLKRGTFKTKSAPDTTPPSNVGNLQGTVVDGDVSLTWTNPKEEDFKDVRIVRNYLFYPASLTDGFIVFEGSGQSHTDKNPFLKTEVQYYTVFSRDTSGNVSSGAIIGLTKNRQLTFVVPKDEEDDTFALSFDDFEFFQNDVLVAEKRLQSERAYLVRIAYEKVPPHLKTITYTVLDEQGGNTQRYSYLLKINRDKTFYEAVISAYGREGTVQGIFSVFDLETKVMTSVFGNIEFYAGREKVDTFLLLPFLTTLALDSKPLTFIFFLFLFLFILFCLYLLRRLFRD